MWAFEHAFYRRFGWATVSKYATATCAPDHLGFVDRRAPRVPDGSDAGRYRELDADDWPAVDVEIDPGAMLRIVDVERTLGALTYLDVERTVALAVTDDLAAWNDGRFRLSAAAGRGTCERIEEGDEALRPDAQVGIGTLSALAVGYDSVEEARRYGDLSVESEGDAATLAALFPRAEPRPFLREGF